MKGTRRFKIIVSVFLRPQKNSRALSSFHFIVGYQFSNCYYFISGLGALQERSGDLRKCGWDLNNPIIPMHPPYSSLLEFLVSEHITTDVKSNKREVVHE